jgi:hypothetical protein
MSSFQKAIVALLALLAVGILGVACVVGIFVIRQYKLVLSESLAETFPTSTKTPTLVYKKLELPTPIPTGLAIVVSEPEPTQENPVDLEVVLEPTPMPEPSPTPKVFDLCNTEAARNAFLALDGPYREYKEWHDYHSIRDFNDWEKKSGSEQMDIIDDWRLTSLTHYEKVKVLPSSQCQSVVQFRLTYLKFVDKTANVFIGYDYVDLQALAELNSLGDLPVTEARNKAAEAVKPQ